MGYYNLKEECYYQGPTCVGKNLQDFTHFYQVKKFTPKPSIFSYDLKSGDWEWYSFLIYESPVSSNSTIYFYENGKNKDILLNGSAITYIPRKFKHKSINTVYLPVKKQKGYNFEFGVFQMPLRFQTEKLISEAIAVLFGYIKYSQSGISTRLETAKLIKDIFDISYSPISEAMYQSYLK